MLNLCRSFLAVSILFAAVCSAQKQSTELSQQLAELRSDQWTDRARAYETLRSDSRAIKNSQVQQALLNLLDEENRLTESTLRNSGEKNGVSDEYGEEYSEYVTALGESVDAFADWSDPRQVCIFVEEAYDPESRFAAKIAAHWKNTLPCLIQLYRSDVGLIRSQASPVIVQALAQSIGNSPGQSITAVAREVVLRSLHDPDEAVRINTIQALKNFGGQDMIPALKEVAQSDPAVGPDGDSIRKWASEAIGEIAKRVSH
jgi:hypothetical protein